MLINLLMEKTAKEHAEKYPAACRNDFEYEIDSAVQDILFGQDDVNTQYAIHELMTRMRWTTEMRECLVACADEALNRKRPTAGPYPYTRMGEMIGNQLLTELQFLMRTQLKEAIGNEN